MDMQIIGGKYLSFDETGNDYILGLTLKPDSRFFFRYFPFEEHDGIVCIDLQKLFSLILLDEPTSARLFRLEKDGSRKPASFSVEESGYYPNIFGFDLRVSMTEENGQTYFLFEREVCKKVFAEVSYSEAKGDYRVTVSEKRPFFFARRNVRMHALQYNCFVPAQFQEDGSISLCDQHELDEHILGQKEIWDLVYSVDGVYCPVYIKGECKGDYLPIGAKFELKPFVSDKYFLAFFTKYGKFTGRKKIKVAIFGSCLTRQVFNSHSFTNPDYRVNYECGLTFFHQSLCSLVSDKIPYDKQKLVASKEAKLCDLYLDAEFSKGYVERLNTYQPDYLIFDFFVDSRERIFVRGNQVLTDAFYLKGANAIEQFPYDLILTNVDERKFELFHASCEKLRKSLEGVIDFKRFIVAKSKAARRYYTANRSVKSFEQDQYLACADYILEEYNAIFLSVFPEARIIDMTLTDYYGDEASFLNLSTNHYVHEYYSDFLDKLNKIALRDILDS